jgi:hypothetical protein
MRVHNLPTKEISKLLTRKRIQPAEEGDVESAYWRRIPLFRNPDSGELYIFTDYGLGYAHSYLHPKVRRYPRSDMLFNARYMSGYMEGQKQWREEHMGRTEDMGSFKVWKRQR